MYETRDYEVKLDLRRELDSIYAVSDEQGMKIYAKILYILACGDRVSIDMRGMSVVIPAFLNVALGQLLSIYTREQLKGRLRVSADSSTLNNVKIVLENAEQFFQNQRMSGATALSER